MSDSATRAGTVRRFTALAAVGCGLAACGGADDYANAPRSPAPITVTAAITDERVEASPRSFGAGPIILVIANGSTRSQEITLETFETASGRPGIRQRTSPINARGTAQLKVEVAEGTYRLSAGSGDVQPVRLSVGPRRASAQNELLQP